VNDRRMAYSIINLLMVGFELNSAREVFLIRLFIYFSDTVLWSSVYSNTPKYLDMNVDMKRMAYPQDCASVWVSMKHMSEICKHIKKLNVKIDNKNFKGLGFVNVHSETGKANVLTIHHVGKCDSLTMDGVIYPRPSVKSLSGADDPIVSIELSPYFGKVCKDVRLLTCDELRNIKQVVVSSLTDDEEEPMMVFTNEFEIDRKGDLRVVSSLQEGDSGGPVFAALNDGSIRYAGAVSRTTDTIGVGHKFALITTSDRMRLDSDSDSDSTERVGNKAAINFNRQRGRSNYTNYSNLTNLCNVQSKLMALANEYCVWVVDAATEKGYRWSDDNGGKFEYDGDSKPDDYDEHKKKYDRKKKQVSFQAKHKLQRISDMVDFAFSDNNERNSFMRLVKSGHSFDYVPGTVVHFVNGILMVDDNPDPSDYSSPD